MKILIIHGQSHKGSTYHIAHLLADKLQGEVDEIFLPRDFSQFCVGCSRCFMEGEENCPHYDSLHPFTEKLDEADVILMESPVYVFHATGSMKAFLDHYGYRWMVHRPSGAMFTKQGIVLSTAAGAGMKGTNKDMADSLFWWGVGRIYRYGVAVNAIKWDEVPNKKKEKIDKELDKIAHKVRKFQGKVKPSLKTRLLFYGLRLMQKKGINPADAKYWKEKGWTAGKKPWKSTTLSIVEYKK